ncbi:hypothetical protein OPQ81_003605 [Rhizoctonia solani]|nr:hypothetical protein OPQ81_003605 [Rhizoctonia solani]
MTIRYTPRSTTGCFTCKRRRKKCDETQPHCLRCTKGGFECEGYPTFDGRIRRVTFDPPIIPVPRQSNTRAEPSETSTNSKSIKSLKEQSESAIAPIPDLSESFSSAFKTPSPNDTTSLTIWNSSALRSSDALHGDPLESNIHLDNSQSLPSDPWHGHLKHLSSYATDPFLLSPSSRYKHHLAHPPDQTPKSIESGQTNPSSHLLCGPTWPSWSLVDDEDPPSDDADDTEGIRSIICRSLTPDPNTQSNALPFVLQAYARWVNFVVFEPLKVAGMIREGVIMQFASSPEVRTRTCLIANVIGKLSRGPELDSKGMSIVSMLRSDAHQNIGRFHSNGPASEREMDMQNALKVLDSMMEMILIQRYSGPLSSVIGLMEAAAPVFRRACPDPPEKLVNLPNILATPGLNLQHFAATDVIISITTARPMFFKYDIECTPEAFTQLVKGDYGLQWLHGVPDQFIVILAWINVLHENYGDNVDPKYVTQIESQVQNVKIKPSHSPDPILLILRLAVQECWRQTVYVYLYMTLCGVRADDPRVVRAVKAFVYIVNGVKPGRNPDSFLFIPIMVVGAFAYRERDRDVLRRRMIGLRECTNPSAASFECLEILEDIWRRTQVENRSAVRSDVRIACRKIAGI